MPPGNYRWYIVAKLDVSAWVHYLVRPAVFTTATAPAYLGIGAP